VDVESPFGADELEVPPPLVNEGEDEDDVVADGVRG
jgi:hypothetical protein